MHSVLKINMNFLNKTLGTPPPPPPPHPLQKNLEHTPPIYITLKSHVIRILRENMNCPYITLYDHVNLDPKMRNTFVSRSFNLVQL